MSGCGRKIGLFDLVMPIVWIPILAFLWMLDTLEFYWEEFTIYKEEIADCLVPVLLGGSILVAEMFLIKTWLDWLVLGK